MLEYGVRDSALIPLVRVAAMAEIVHDLLAGGDDLLHDVTWLRNRAADAGLNAHERGALDDLAARLRVGGSALLQAISVHWA
jgi:hypothetical protein